MNRDSPSSAFWIVSFTVTFRFVTFSSTHTSVKSCSLKTSRNFMLRMCAGTDRFSSSIFESISRSALLCSDCSVAMEFSTVKRRKR